MTIIMFELTAYIIKNALDIEIIKKMAKFWSKLSVKNYPGVVDLKSHIENILFTDNEFKTNLKRIVDENELEFISNDNVYKMIKYAERCLF